ncbi:MAG: inositol monophosphatase family protein, partial [Halobacteriota archaeon]
MQRPSIDELAAVAETAARTGGEYLREQFRDGDVDGEYGIDDVKTVADREAESRVLSVIEDAYPEHAIHGEEIGRRRESPHRWIVDP